MTGNIEAAMILNDTSPVSDTVDDNELELLSGFSTDTLKKADKNMEKKNFSSF